MRESSLLSLMERRQVLLDQASAALRGHVVGLWRLTDGGRTVVEIVSPSNPPREMVEDCLGRVRTTDGLSVHASAHLLARPGGRDRRGAENVNEGWKVGKCHLPTFHHSNFLGSCWVKQCSVPSPHTRSPAWIPTTGRSEKHSARMPSATRSCESLKVGTSTAALAT